MAQVSHREQGDQRGGGRPRDVPQLHARRERRAPRQVWDRVAGGEVAIRPELAKKLPTDEQGYLRLGSEQGRARRSHVGAFAPQIAAGRRGRQRVLDPDPAA